MKSTDENTGGRNLDDDVGRAATNDDELPTAGKNNTNSPRDSCRTENDEVGHGISALSPRHSSMLRILVKAIFLSVPHIDLPSAQPPSVAMARHAKSQSISSDTPNAKVVKTPAPKFPTPVKAAARRSAASPPASPSSAFTPVRSTPPRKSQIPFPLQFPLVVILSFSLSTLLYSFIAEIGTGELASISKHSESWLDAAGLLAWKAVLLAVSWFGGFDGTTLFQHAIKQPRPTAKIMLKIMLTAAHHSLRHPLALPPCLHTAQPPSIFILLYPPNNAYPHSPRVHRVQHHPLSPPPSHFTTPPAILRRQRHPPQPSHPHRPLDHDLHLLARHRHIRSLARTRLCDLSPDMAHHALRLRPRPLCRASRCRRPPSSTTQSSPSWIRCA